MSELLSEARDSVLYLTIHRPERRNAMTPQVIAGIGQAIEGAQRDASIRAIVLTGTGDKAFCAGGDLQAGNPFAVDASDPYQAGANLFRIAKRSTVPLIARINGACMAGGMGLLAMCDMAVAAQHAIFGLPEAKVGGFPAQVLTMLQPQIPRRVLTQMCLAGRVLNAQEALDFHLVNLVSDDLDAGVQEILDGVLACAPAALRRGLYTMKKIEAMPFEESMSFTESQISLFALTEDAKEGAAAFREKRRPVWAGR